MPALASSLHMLQDILAGTAEFLTEISQSILSPNVTVYVCYACCRHGWLQIAGDDSLGTGRSCYKQVAVSSFLNSLSQFQLLH